MASHFAVLSTTAADMQAVSNQRLSGALKMVSGTCQVIGSLALPTVVHITQQSANGPSIVTCCCCPARWVTYCIPADCLAMADPCTVCFSSCVTQLHVIVSSVVLTDRAVCCCRLHGEWQMTPLWFRTRTGSTKPLWSLETRLSRRRTFQKRRCSSS